MLKHRDLTLQRCRQFQARLETAVYDEVEPVSLKCFAAPGRIPYEEAMQGDYTPIKIGHRFGPKWSTHWVHVAAVIPETWAGREVHLRWNSNCEACAWEDGRTQQGFSPGNHDAYRLACQACGEDKVSLHLEVACNTLFGVGDCDPLTLDFGVLDRAEIAVFNPGVWELLWDFATICGLAAELPKTPRGEQALRVANEIVNVCDPSDPAGLAAAREIAHPFLSIPNTTDAFALWAIGHAHIDTAWLWPLAETIRKCARSFSTTLRYMEDHPDYLFVCSQAQQWEWMQARYPELYERMCASAREGRFIPAGGSWVEFDCNIPCGESMIRQYLYGQKFFKEHLDTTCREFWNPDVFGYSGQLPQIMRHCEIEHFLTQKISWNQFNSFPHHSFMWEGIDGSQVLTHFPPSDTYNSDCTVKELLYTVRNYRDLERSTDAYHLFGIGDGGGGPTQPMLERLKRAHDTSGLPRMQTCSPDEFFQQLATNAVDLQTWVGELYLELHRGTYTTHARNKKYNRQCERLLQTTEALHAILGPDRYPAEELERLWKLVLLNQFHDIIPGSSIREVYEDSTRHYEEVIEKAHALCEQAVDMLSPSGDAALLVVNPLGHSRREVVELPSNALSVVSAPACGYAVTTTTPPTESVTAGQTGDTFTLENGLVRATLAASGRLVSLFDKRAERELIDSDRPGNNLVLFEDRPANYDAWDVDVFHMETRDDAAAASTCRIVEEDPLRSAVEFTYDLGHDSSASQIVRLTAVSPRLDFVTTVDWHASHQFLKVEFPWLLRSSEATYEIQYGHLQRPTHFNTSWDMARFEVCGQRWADLSEPDYGVTLMTDSKYGYGTHGNVMRISLLRSTKMPDTQADMGAHAFTYSVFPHAAPVQAAGVVDEAANLNAPLILRGTDAPPCEVSWFSTDAPALKLDTIKRAEDGTALILRLYEAHGTRGTTHLHSGLSIASAARCTGLENPLDALTCSEAGIALDYRPFEIISLRLVAS